MKRITIKNFQAHAKRVIEFDPNITTIVGSSDVGKSSILRSLIWVLTNKPTGDAFIRDGEDICEVELDLGDGNIIKRTRGKSANIYELNGTIFKAFGNDVPEEISKILNINKVNIQSQHDAPWWFSETDGEISRQLNAIVDLSVIDRTLNNLDSLNRATAAEKKVLLKQQETAKESLKTYSWLRNAHESLERIETIDRNRQEHTVNRLHLTNGVQAVQSITLAIETTQKAQKHLLEVIQKGEELNTLEKSCNGLGKLIESIEELETKVNVPIPEVEPLILLFQRLEQHQSQKRILGNGIITVEQLLNEIKQLKKSSEEYQTKFKTELGDTCPLCQSKLSQ